MPYQREFAQRIPAAVIGAGSHCYRNILPVLNYLPVELRAVCNPSEDRGKATARQYGCVHYSDTESLYRNEADIAAVFIIVSPQMHPSLVKEALAKGKHVWVEKPAALRALEVRDMISARKDKVVVVAHKKAFMPAALKAKEIAASGKYGNLKSILAVYPMTIPENGEEILEKREAPNWLLNGVHPLSFLSEIGGKADEVCAYTNKQGYGTVVIRFAGGVMGNLHLASGPKPSVERYELFGESWQMSIQDQRVELRRGIPFDYARTTTFVPEGDDSGTIVWNAANCLATLENKALFTQGFYGETKYFCDCILEGRQPVSGTGSLEQALEIMRIYEAALLSHGKPVKL